MPDLQLRDFAVETPRVEFIAEMHIPDSAGSWPYAPETPSPDSPPKCSDKIEEQRGGIFTLIPHGNTEFGQVLRGRIASAADAIVSASANLFNTAHWFGERRATKETRQRRRPRGCNGLAGYS